MSLQSQNPLPSPQSSAVSCHPCSAIDCATLNGGTPSVCAELMPAINQHHFEAGAILPFTDTRTDKVIVVAVGTVRIEWILQDGRRHILGFLHRGDLLVGPGDIPEVQASAVTAGILYYVEKDTFERCRRQRLATEKWKQAIICEQAVNLAAHGLLLSRLTAREKVVAFLVDLARRIGTQTAEGIFVPLAMSREDIADHLGLKPETVSRTLSGLKNDALLVLPRPGHAVIKDWQTFSALSPLSYEPEDHSRSDAA